MPSPTVAELEARFGARPIPGCPGRAVLLAPPSLGIEALVGTAVAVEHYAELPSARDAVCIARLADGGVISFVRPDGAWVHTLNSPDGFRRRLARFGLAEAQDG